MPADFNITKSPAAPSLPKNNLSGNGNPIAKMADKATTRNIAPITEFNNETGLVEARPDSPWGRNNDTTTETETTETTETNAETPHTGVPDRYTAWKTEQAVKKEERAAQQTAKKVKSEALAQDLLRKGDLVGAAKALNMSPSDLAAYVDNARLQIPNPDKKLSPEEQYKADEKKFKEDRLAFEQEQRDFKRSVIKDSYIKSKIAPVVQDQEAFEFIHLNDVNKITDYIYEFMNNHFAETGEELLAKDVAENIERTMKETFIEGLKKTEKLKASAEFFASKKAATSKTSKTDEIEDIETEDDTTSRLMKRKVSTPISSGFKPEPTLANKVEQPLYSRFPMQNEELEELEAEAEELIAKTTPPLAKRRSSEATSNIPFAFLSKAERMALMKAGK